MFKERFGRLMFERKLYFWLILGGGTYHVPQRGDPYIRYTLVSVKGTYLLWYIWIQSAPIQTFIWNRVYRSSNRLHVWDIQPLPSTQQLKYKRRLHLVIEPKKKNIQKHRIRFSCHSTTLFRILLLGIPGSRMDSWNAKLRNLNKRSKRQIRADEKFSCHHQNFPWKHELTLKTFRKFKSSYSQVNSAQKTKLSFWGN